VTAPAENANENYWRLMEESLRTMEQSAELMQRSSDLIDAMHSYRIYLLDMNGDIDAAESFSTSTDDEAADVASLVYEASNDVFSGYEIWDGRKCIVSMQSPRANRYKRRNFDAAVERHQDTVLELEEKLEKAFACVKRSRKLLQATARIRDRMKVSGSQDILAESKRQSGSQLNR
jgi:hypothetical protein